MKKTLSAVLALSLLFSALPLFALAEDAAPQTEEADPGLITFARMQELVKTEGPDIRKNELTYKNALSTNNAGSVYVRLNEQISAISAALAYTSDPTEAAKLKEQGAQLSIQAAGMNLTPKQQDLLRMQVDKGNMLVQRGAESIYLGLLSLERGLAAAQRSLPLAQQGLKAAETAFAAGMGTEQGVLRAKLAVGELESTILKLQADRQGLVFALNQMLGRAYDAALAVQLPEPDLAYMDAAKLDKDLAAMAAKNLDILSAKRDRSGMKDDDDYIVNVREIQLKDMAIKTAEQKAASALTVLYATIAVDRAALANAKTKLALEVTEVAAAEAGFAKGQISELALKQAKEKLNAQQDALDTATQTLFTSINTYKWALQGLPIAN